MKRVLAALLVLAAPAVAEEMVLSAAPAGTFEFQRTGKGDIGKWELFDDVTATGGKAFTQTSRDRNDYRFPLAIIAASSLKDGTVTIRFKPLDGKVDRAGGIAIRLADRDNYYVVRANALEDNVRFYRVVRGDRRQIAGADVKVKAGEWHTLTLSADGDRFTIGFDGKELFTATDKTFAQPGKVALWTKADSLTEFDKIDITPR
jgi:hypothetical protein